MKSLKQWFNDYEVSHQNAFNKKIHYIFVPLIFFSIIGLLASVPTNTILETISIPQSLFPYLNLATLLIIISSIFYIRLSLPLSIGLFLFSIFCLWLNYQISVYSSVSLWIIATTIFAVSWIFQFIGHKHEGKKPSFIKDLQFLLVGPAWILAKIYKKLKIDY